ncbi:Replication initiator A N-terminal domain-containing protein, partial [Dysosmobacter welbionis]
PAEPAGLLRPAPGGETAGLPADRGAEGGGTLLPGPVPAAARAVGGTDPVQRTAVLRLLLHLGLHGGGEPAGHRRGDPAGAAAAGGGDRDLRHLPGHGGHPQPCAAGDSGAAVDHSERLRLPGLCRGAGAGGG